MQDSHRQLTRLLIAVFTLLQFVILAIFGYTPYPDSEGYILLARQCIEHDDLYPITSQLNDYPFLWNIGAINAVVFSLKLFNSVIPILVLYALIKGTTAWFLYQTTKVMVNSKVAFITLLLYILYPANYGESTSTLSELPFMFFCMLALWLVINRKLYIMGGIMLAIANWFRPMAIVFLLALLIYLRFTNRKTLRPLVGYIAMIAVIGSLCYLRTGLFLYQAKSGWMNLAVKTYESGQQDEWKINPNTIRDHIDWNVSQKDSAWKHMYIEWIMKHPGDYIRRMPDKLFRTYISDNVNMCTFIPNKNKKEYMYEEISMPTLVHHFPNYSPVQWFTLLNLLYYFCLLLTAFYSIRYYQKETYLLPICIIGIGTVVLLMVGHGESRFHVPFMPFIIILSALLINKKIWRRMG